MILIVETARELIEILATEVQTLEDELKTQDSVQEVKKKLEIVNQELDSFDAYLIKRKTDELRKDIRWFTQEEAYPYLADKYYQNYNQTDQYKQKVNLMLGVSEHYSKANNNWRRDVKKAIQEVFCV
ncbi:hypothetical protein NDU88_005525, partial [Pleurodeles waltl]